MDFQARWSSTQIRSAKAKRSRTKVSPNESGIGQLNIGPAYTKEWNSPFSPHGSTSGGSADKIPELNSRPTNDTSSFSVSTHGSLARKPDAIITPARARGRSPHS